MIIPIIPVMISILPLISQFVPSMLQLFSEMTQPTPLISPNIPVIIQIISVKKLIIPVIIFPLLFLPFSFPLSVKMVNGKLPAVAHGRAFPSRPVLIVSLGRSLSSLLIFIQYESVKTKKRVRVPPCIEKLVTLHQVITY